MEKKSLGTGEGSKMLENFLKEVGWFDLWRIRNPGVRVYSWHAPGRKSMSRIDLALGNEKILPMVHLVTYMLKEVSDHSGLIYELKIGPRGRRPGYRIQPYWLAQIGSNDRIPEQIEMFLEAHGDSIMEGVTWDTFKAYLRVIVRSTISYIKHANRQEEEEMEDVCKKAEAEFIKNPSIMNQIKWVGAVRQYKNQLIVKNKCKRLQSKQKNFEQGYYANKIVNYLIKQQASTLVITEVRDEKGEDIGRTFYRYYEKMYTSTLTCTGEEIEKYVEDLEFLRLTEEQKGELEKDIEVEEVKEAIKSMGKGK